MFRVRFIKGERRVSFVVVSFFFYLCFGEFLSGGVVRLVVG